MLRLKLRHFYHKRALIVIVPLLLAIAYAYYHESQRIIATPIDAWESDATADCAVVLTGGPGRVKEGLDLLLRKQVQRVIVAGVNPQVGLRDLYPQLILYPQVNEKDLVLERRSETTYGNALQSLPIVEALQCRSILLVTSYLHMNRALRTFVSTYPRDIVVTPYSIAGNEYPPHHWDLLIEVVKTWFYALWAY